MLGVEPSDSYAVVIVRPMPTSRDQSTPLFSMRCCARLSVLFAAAAFGLLRPAPTIAADGFWNVDADGTWSNTANWLNGTIAAGTDFTAYFANDITTTRTITLDLNRTIGNLVFNDGGTSGSPWILSRSTGTTTLTLATSSVTPRITTSTDTVINAILAGTQGLIKDGAGTLILTGTNSYSGGTTITAGTLQIGLNSSGSILGDVQITSGTLAFDRGAFDIYTFNGRISGSGVLKLSSGTLLLTQANGFSGTTFVDDANLRISNSLALQNSMVVVNSVMTLLAGVSTYTVAGITGSGSIQLGGSIPGVVPVLALGSNNISTTFNGLITGSGGLLKAGTGTLVLTAANSYAGGTAINDGVLKITGNVINGSVVNNGLLIVDPQQAFSTSITFSKTITGTGGLISTGTLILTGSNSYTGGTTILGALELRDTNIFAGIGPSIVGSVVNNGLLAFNRSSSMTLSGEISGTGGLLIKGNFGTLILTASNSFTGPISIEAGTLQLGDGGAVGSLAVRDIMVNGTLSFNRSDTVILDKEFYGSGFITQTGSGVLVLPTENPNFDGSVLINAGAIRILANSSLTNIGVMLNVDDGLMFSSGVTTPVIRSLIGTGRLNLMDESGSPVVLKVEGGNTPGFVYGGVLEGSGALFKAGTGTLTMTGNSAYTGGTTIDGGTLQLGNGGTSGSVPGNILVNGTLIFNRSDALTYDGVLTGTGSLMKRGAGTLVLKNSNSISGVTSIGAGSIRLANNAALQNSTVIVNAVGGLTFSSGVNTPVLGGLSGTGNFTLADDSGAAVVLTVGGNNAGTTFTGALGGPGGLIKVGAGTFTLRGTNTYTGGTTISDGTLAIAGSTGSIVGSIVSTGTLRFNRTDTYVFDGFISGSGSVQQAGTGVVVLTQANSYSGPTTISSGSIRLANDLALQNSSAVIGINGGITFSSGINSPLLGGLSGTRNISLVDDSNTPVVLTAGGNNASTGYGGVLDGVGGLIKIGTGTLTLTGANSYSGGTTIVSGTLQIGSVNSGSLIGNVVTSGTLAISRNNTYSFAGLISGTGNVSKSGLGLLVFTQANSYSGLTVIANGMLRAGNGSAFGTSSVVIQSNGRLDVSSGITISNSITFSNGGTLSGVGTVASNVTISNGAILAPGNSPGTLHFSGILEWGPGGHYMWEINDVDAGAGVDPGWDFVDIAGQLLVTSTVGGQYAIDVTSLMLSNTSGPVHDFDPALDYDWIIAQATGGIMGFDAAAFQITTTGFTNSFNGAFSLLQSGNAIVLHYTAVPEPGTMMLTTIATGGWYVRRRRKQRRARQ